MANGGSWSYDENECLGNVEGNTQLFSTSSSSHSQRRSVDYLENDAMASKSCDDLLQNVPKRKIRLQRSQSCITLSSLQIESSPNNHHVYHDLKEYIKVLHNDNKTKSGGRAGTGGESSKEEYLQEINLRLSRELEEKNAILQQLQENYEHLLLKYAEAQNKIDTLRLKTVSDARDNVCQGSLAQKSFRKHIIAPSIYPFNARDSSNLSLDTHAPRTEVVNDKEVKVDRPSTLSVESHLRLGEKDALKAVTPTDSEGVSSVITSMSGHSKILTNLDDTPKQIQNEQNTSLKSEVLENVLPSNDPFDKVKNWQNSLPPLDMIETPDTTLYDLNPLDPAITPSTKYNDFPMPNISETDTKWTKHGSKTMSQAVMKKYLRTLSLPSSLTRRNIMTQIYKRRNNATIDLVSPLHGDFTTALISSNQPESNKSASPPSRKICSSNIIQKRKKRPPFLRSASLPIYELDTPRSTLRSDIPPLDLDNLTLSDDKTSPDSKTNLLTSPSFLNSHDCSFQTLESLNSCKATLSDFSGGSFRRQPIIHKSTSITPDRSKGMILFEGKEEEEDDCCNVCGESVASLKRGLHLQSQETKLSQHRSILFTSESNLPSRCFHAISSEQDSFDAYAHNLKSRSQVIMKALSAHVKNT